MLSHLGKKINPQVGVKTKGRNLSLLTANVCSPGEGVLKGGGVTLTLHASLSVTLLSVKGTIMRSHVVAFFSGAGESEKGTISHLSRQKNIYIYFFYFSMKRENLISPLESTDSERATKM